MYIGDVIASVRRRKRIEQKELANAIGKSISYLSQIENNRRKPSIQILKLISSALDVPLSGLLFMVLEEKHFSGDSKKELYNMAKPIMDDVINLLSNPKIKSAKTEAKTRLRLAGNRKKMHKRV
jgi:transcriptional regulator with XRE-family HTH domain